LEGSLSHTKIVLGGPDVTYNQFNYLSAGADFLVIGEGEETLYELIDCLSSNTDITSITGLAYLVDGVLKTNAARVKMKDLDQLPNPNRAAIPIDKYLETWKKAHGKSALNVSTQRG